MQITKKHSVSLIRTLGNGFILGALALTVAGCVAEPSPRGYYGYSGDTYYTTPSSTTVVTEPGATVIVHDNNAGYYDNEPMHNYDDHQEYGRIGNGNYHGEGDDDVHTD